MTPVLKMTIHGSCNYTALDFTEPHLDLYLGGQSNWEDALTLEDDVTQENVLNLLGIGAAIFRTTSSILKALAHYPLKKLL